MRGDDLIDAALHVGGVGDVEPPGRAAAAEVDTFLMGETVLPAPVRPTDVAIGLLPA